uniref:Methyltransferase 4, N6-adenosine n=1 Tax=Hucho hucho TaxID=62062 RepID=A0A4W5P0B6_9TELE
MHFSLMYCLRFRPQVTRSGEYVFPLDSPHKKPYEVLVLGRYRGCGHHSHSSLRMTELPMEEQRVIVSVPSALHSHKPSLSGGRGGEVLLNVLLIRQRKPGRQGFLHCRRSRYCVCHHGNVGHAIETLPLQP